MANPSLRPERTETFEVDVEHKLTKRLDATVSAYHYTLHDLIQAVPDGAIVQYRNVSRAQANGIEFELNGHPWRRSRLWQVSACSVPRRRRPAAGSRIHRGKSFIPRLDTLLRTNWI